MITWQARGRFLATVMLNMALGLTEACEGLKAHLASAQAMRLALLQMAVLHLDEDQGSV